MAAQFTIQPGVAYVVSTHSHPKVAAYLISKFLRSKKMFQHTATRRWLPMNYWLIFMNMMFQHTATRRWLLKTLYSPFQKRLVSTHSHPKVAARYRLRLAGLKPSFNTQPPEGGCFAIFKPCLNVICFNTQPPEGGCLHNYTFSLSLRCFNTQPPEGGCSLHKKARKISKLNTVFR